MRSTLKAHAQASRRLAAAFAGKPEQAEIEALSEQTKWLEQMLTHASIARLSPAGGRRVKGPGGLPGRTLIELPPAGFLPCSSDGLETVRDAVETYLASPGLVRRVCRCSLSDVGRLFEHAQHRDRTNLVSPNTKTGETEAVDVHVPSDGDRATTSWVLFTRTERVECPERESPEEDAPPKPSPAAEESPAPSSRANARARAAKTSARKQAAPRGGQ